MPDLHTVRAFLEPHHHRIAEQVARFCADSIDPLPHCADDLAARQQAREILALLGDGGWIGYAIPARHGGKLEHPDLRACALIREALAATSPLADSVFALQCLGAMPIVLAGNDDTRDRWLPDVIAGRSMAAFAMTEPSAGSDVTAMQTRAVRDGDHYVLTGRKHLISNAGIADFYTTFAVTDPEHQRLSCFAVPADTPGLEFVAAQPLSEPHPLGVIDFNECRVPATARLGSDGQGFKLGMAALDRLRPTVAAAACGMAERALSEATAYARSRRQFGSPLADFQMVQQKLATMAIDLTAARLLTYRAAWERDGGADRITVEAAMAKAFATEAAQRIIDQSLQIHGGRGVLADHPVERLYRAIRPLRIYEGTTEIQYLIVARDLLR